jgi:putative iron-regulated protein
MQVVAPSARPAGDALRAQAIRFYVEGALARSREAVDASQLLVKAVKALCESPSESTLRDARLVWCAARKSYGRTEVYRFGDGPIDRRRDGVETFVNAWPVDENYIEPADPQAATGIIRDRVRYPVLARAVVREHNQRGGETHVSTGWHAIEFMLWGRDADAAGPGARPASDFVDGAAPNADRRREYLLEITTLLHEDLQRVARAWESGPTSHAAALEASPQRALRAMCIGPALLAGFEMAGERLAVPLETRDQEEEHSCFSDSTDDDFKANIEGIALVLRGPDGGPGLIDLVRASDAVRADALASALQSAEVAVAAMPHPFDASIREPDEGPRRQAMRAAMLALERLGEQASLSAGALGIRLPTEPQG